MRGVDHAKPAFDIEHSDTLISDEILIEAFAIVFVRNAYGLG
jgi:hypothetical protein